MRMLIFLIFSLFFPYVFGLVCPKDYTLILGEKCLKLVETPETHWVAEQNCKANSGTLVNIKTAIDNRAVYNFANTNGVTGIWIGLFCFGNSSSTCFWDNGSGSPVAYNNFKPYYPFESFGRCVVMGLTIQGRWISMNCDNRDLENLNKLAYVCEVSPTVLSSACTNNYDKNCYTTSRKAENIATASANCANYGALSSIHSKMEIDYIRNLYKSSNISTIYLGAQLDSTKRFEWLDGSPWNFNYMDPLNFQSGNCLVMDVSGNGLWSQVDCNQSHDFLCKQKLTDSATIEKKIAPETIQSGSNCNSTLYLAPGSISSFGYPNFDTPPSFCSWRLVALGPYRLGMFFDFWATFGKLTIYDEDGNDIGQYMEEYNREPFSIYAPFNIATVVFEPKSGNSLNIDRGFHAVVLPI